jgi:outer membrane protein assembly factor BamB
MSALVSVILASSFPAQSQNPTGQSPVSQRETSQNVTIVTVRWGARTGVARYRLQVAKDATFADIVFDRVVSGHEYRMTDLPPGKYFWRVASLTAKRGEFSSAGVIDVRDSAPANEAPRIQPLANTIDTGAGWYAAIGNVAKPVLVHLRSPNRLDVVGINHDGRTFALDGASGVALWTARPENRLPNAAALAPLAIRTRTGMDNVLVVTSNIATMRDGRTGREIWQTTLPGVAASASALRDRIFIIDNSLRKLFVIEGNDGKLIGQAQLARRAVGAPAAANHEVAGDVMLALDDGRIAILDQTGKIIRAGDAGSPATTAPLFVRTARGGLVLIGTKSGLTALNAADLRPLGRVTLKNDAPRGALSAQDLDADGVNEVVMFTERGRIAVVKSDEGKIVWEGDARQADAVAFADVNSDRVFDLLMAGREGFAFALSGRDGVMIWKEDGGSPGVAANHAPSPVPRAALVAPLGTGVLLIAGDPFRGGVRAVQFSKASAPPN